MAVGLFVRLEPSPRRAVRAAFDDLVLVEWRPPGAAPTAADDHLRSPVAARVAIELRHLPGGGAWARTLADQMRRAARKAVA